MNLKITDAERIGSIICKKKWCENKSYAILHTKFLCKTHFREEKPIKEKNYRDGRNIRLSVEYFKEPYYMV